jgi:hypothetical protein
MQRSVSFCPESLPLPISLEELILVDPPAPPQPRGRPRKSRAGEVTP